MFFLEQKLIKEILFEFFAKHSNVLFGKTFYVLNIFFKLFNAIINMLLIIKINILTKLICQFDHSW